MRIATKALKKARRSYVPVGGGSFALWADVVVREVIFGATNMALPNHWDGYLAASGNVSFSDDLAWWLGVEWSGGDS